MTDPTPTASGDLEARKAVALVLLQGKTGALADMILGLPEAQERGLEILTDAIFAALDHFPDASKMVPANPPATAAGAGEAVGEVTTKGAKVIIPSRDATPLAPASHDAMIARVREGLWRIARYEDQCTADEWDESARCLDEAKRMARALLTDLDARDGG